MTKSEYTLTVAEYISIEDLDDNDKWLLNEAREATRFAYAPYSDFHVGAIAKLINGAIVTGTNQENASFPAGICAERVLLSSVASQFPAIAIETVAISYKNGKGKSDKPVSPCGLCRQSLAEYQQRMQKPIRIILSGQEGKVQIIENALELLPMAFSSEDILSTNTK